MAETTLSRLYYSLSKPSAFSSAARLYKFARREHRELTLAEVEQWLQAQDPYTLHKRARKKLSAEPRIFVKHIDDQWCVDLCDMSNIADENEDHRYILTCIDVFSKYAWAAPVKQKTGGQVSQAMKVILDSTPRIPKRMESDKGKEFYNHIFQKLLETHNIHHFSTNSRHKASVVERFNRSLKTLLYRSFTARDSNNWLNLLSTCLQTYNSRTHRSIGVSPSSVTTLNEKSIFQRLYGGKKPSSGRLYKVGQLVRISKVKRTFEKGYLPNFTEEIFKISAVKQGKPHRYVLKDLLGELVEGKFVSGEITPVKKSGNDVWKIEKVIKKDRKGRFFVKWKGFPDKFNSWVNEIVHNIT